MLSRIVGVSTRRVVRSFSSRSGPTRRFPRSGFLLGAGTVTATYLAWHLSAQDKWIALDSETQLPKPADAISTTTSVSKKLKKKESEPRQVERAKSESAAESEPDPEHGHSEQGKTKTSEGSSPGAVEEATEAEAGGGAFNPVTGEINWDCPCLGGMAHGPCGPEFREAFSCFVYSEDEPKGINCVEKFKGMQDCFRRHPEIYAEEIMDDEDEEHSNASPSSLDSPPESELESEASTPIAPQAPSKLKTKPATESQ